MMKKMCVRGVLALFAVLSVFWLGSSAMAQEGEDPGLARALRGLEWQQPSKKVLNHFKKLKEGEFAEQSAKVRDPIEKERMRKLKLAEFAKIEKSKTKLKGSRTGYEVSVIEGEYRPNNNESLLVVRDEAAQRYYMFADGRLWKLVIAYNPQYIEGIGFEAFVDQVTSKYGEPEDTVYTDDEYLTSATWRDEKTELRIEDKSDFFNTFTMVFADRDTAARMDKFQKAFGSKKKQDTVAREIMDIQEDSSFANNDDVVDSIIGSKVEVDLERGRPEDTRARRVNEEALASANADLPSEEVKKRKKGRRRKGKRKGKGKGKGKADSLIIY